MLSFVIKPRIFPRFAAYALLLASVSACTNGSAGTDQPSVEEPLPALGGEGDDEEIEPRGDDKALRRKYASAEMRRHECVNLGPDGSFVGSNCPSGCVLYGPYLTAPTNADVRLAFEIESSSKLTLLTDLVSAQGKTYHGATEDLVLNPSEKRTLGYRVHFFQPAHSVEGRVWVQGEEPANFRIYNFRLEIE